VDENSLGECPLILKNFFIFLEVSLVQFPDSFGRLERKFWQFGKEIFDSLERKFLTFWKRKF
jgi:hypothetical protein